MRRWRRAVHTPEHVPRCLRISAGRASRNAAGRLQRGWHGRRRGRAPHCGFPRWPLPPRRSARLGAGEQPCHQASSQNEHRDARCGDLLPALLSRAFQNVSASSPTATVHQSAPHLLHSAMRGCPPALPSAITWKFVRACATSVSCNQLDWQRDPTIPIHEITAALCVQCCALQQVQVQVATHAWPVVETRHVVLH